MLAAAAVALILCSPSSFYERTDNITVEFAEGSAELSPDEREKIAALMKPLVGDEMAEVQLQAYFAYGDRSGSLVPGASGGLVQDRFDAIADTAIEIGVSPDLIGARQTAIGYDLDASGNSIRVPFPPERLLIVEMDVRVKTDCHPLADLARRTNPYD